MKNIIALSCILLAAMLFSASQSFGQKPDRIVSGIEMSSSSSSEFKTMEFSADLGAYATKWMAVTLKGATTVGMFEINGDRTYQRAQTLGPNLYFKLLSVGNRVLSINTSCGATLGSEAWKYTYYSGGVYYGSGRGEIKSFVGLGVKYYDPHRSNFKDYTQVYLSFGFRWQ